MAEPLSKLAEKCKSCPKSKKCDHKRMELCALADLPPQNLASATQGILMDAAMPVLREEIKSPLSPFRYKDELEKALNDLHFGNMFMNGVQKAGERMKHQKEWYTCDRCGAGIKFKPRQQIQYVPCGIYSEPVARFTEDEISCELYKTRFCGKLKKTYELCPKCRKDFERFMRNDC